ncbi:SRPBCC family protein [Enterovirga sp. GCM10030262]|uniref:SRPBCC family protein n=1 Tax=Enterovirga sp. GCM10030262 TaxID=3273391 RepID=UPI00361EBBC5
MELKFEVAGRIARPVEEVFEAIVDPGTLSRYFTTGGAEGRIEPGATVSWSFHDFPGAFPVEVAEVEKNKRIVLRWEADENDPSAKYDTIVTMRFEALEDGRTLLSIGEEGWRETPAGLKASYGNCMGWSQMLCAMKAWVEYGINLREGMYK